MYNNRKLIYLAIKSRVAIILLQFIFNQLIPDHDSQSFQYKSTKKNAADEMIFKLFGGFVRWDAQYFMHIGLYGYTHENTLAFFPLYPITSRLVSTTLISSFISFESILLLVFLAINFVFFILAVLSLYNLSVVIFNDQAFAYKSCTLFCFNPASIFFTAPYTECLFCYLSFQSMLNCIRIYKKGCKLRQAYLIWPIMLSTLVRSNGILNIGFLCYAFINSGKLISGGILAAFASLPFLGYQYYCYLSFCTDFQSNIVAQPGLIAPGTFSQHNQTWCSSKLPLAYTYVQSHYWNMGFLNYYQLKQTPNFLLAAPILAIMICNCWKYFARNRTKLFTFEYLVGKKIRSVFSPVTAVFQVHGLALAIFCALWMHVQVSTRMLASSTPLFYWFCANFKRRSAVLFVKIYFGCYFLLGVIMFCNNLPWT